MVTNNKKKSKSLKKSSKDFVNTKVLEEKEPQTRKSSKKGIIIFVIVLFVVFFVGEIYYVTKKSMAENKRPEFVGSWTKINLGYTHCVVYGDNFYMVDNERGQIYVYEKLTGKSKQVLNLEEGVFGIAQLSDGKMYVLHKNNLLSILSSDGKVTNKINFGTGNFSYIWIDVDSKDNVYLVDGINAKIIKFSPNMEKISEFGGKGSSKDKFTFNPGKAIVGPFDEIYCLERGEKNQANVKVFDANGKFKRMFQVKHLKQITNLENLAISPDGDVYINDFGASKVVIYNNKGKYMGTFDTDSNKQFLITYPGSICGDKDYFYVATHKIGIFKYIKY